MTDSEPQLIVLCDRYPELSETFIVNEVAALERAGARVRVESVASPVQPAAAVPPAAAVWELESTGERARAMLWLACRHPWGCARDVLHRRRRRRAEPVPALRMLAPAARRFARSGATHLHVHFAAGAALSALRISALVDLPYSVTAHGYDIYQLRANLEEKLARAAFATSGCDYTVAELRRVAGPRGAERVHRIVMGVDADVFRRTEPLPGGRNIVAIGRLVEKKGFADLVEATAIMSDAGDPPERVTIAGDGPLRAELAARIEALQLDGIVELVGAVAHDRVRVLLERADVLCMPCVVAANGDRDSMPVVVKEALAMELQVVATDEVGLPELVRADWGTLVAPHDPPGLAAALRAELARPVEQRAARGRAGREFVLHACNPDIEARKLADLIRRVRAAG